MTAADETYGPISRRERRYWWLCLVALVVLIPLSFIVTNRLHLENLAQAREFFVTEILSGESESYAGARWKLEAYRAITDSPDPRFKWPEDRALVLVRLSASLTRDAGESWLICGLTLVDGEGRRWDPLRLTLTNDIEKLIAPDGIVAPGCSTVAFSQPKMGTNVVMDEKFVVPKEALATLSARFSVVSERPWALSFPLKH
ncbi:MAG: hypothetical protein ACRECW_06170 [Phyllobacterium sp.]